MAIQGSISIIHRHIRGYEDNRTALPLFLHLPSPRSTSELNCFYLLCTVSPPSHCIYVFLLFHFSPTFTYFTFIPHRYFVFTPC
jgi:hypothetical protein